VLGLLIQQYTNIYKSMVIPIIIFLLAIFLLWKVYSVYKIQQKSNSKGLGILSILKGRRFASTELTKLVDEEKIKDGFIHFWAGPNFGMAAIHPDAAKFVLKSSDDFPKQFISPQYFREKFGYNLVSVNGDVWRRHRNYVNSGFNSKAYNEYYPTFSLMVEKTLSKMEADAKIGDVEMRNWFSKFTLDLLGNSIFHHDFGRLEDKSTYAYDSYTQLLLLRQGNFYGRLLTLFPWLDYLPIPPTNRFHSAVDNIISLFHQIIKERQSGQKYGDILDNLLNSQTEKTGGLSQTELISNLWIFFLAGHETTSSALTSECICLAKYPDIQEKIYQEIQNTIGNGTPSLDDLSKLSYLDNFIHEVMRLHPPVSFLPTRKASRDVQYNDQVIPKDTFVGLFISSIHKHPDFWPNPENFDPDRFLPENKKGRHHYAYLPFSLGPRQCIGNIFSLIEQRLFLTRLLQKFRVLPPKNSPLHSQPLRFGTEESVFINLELR